ncbi:hypothetical protein KIMC2_17150 [Xylocopilactobacillus apis]|uniref:Uncharacterized protein n=1 Tax=Xylocopilactobacillus apis TaxID=2932183 RepID=A0AAU9DTP8_9LACO|nr:hypothetical protein KIMC2_17150 [Xylocopilactobacillus apis]
MGAAKAKQIIITKTIRAISAPLFCFILEKDVVEEGMFWSNEAKEKSSAFIFLSDTFDSSCIT